MALLPPFTPFKDGDYPSEKHWIGPFLKILNGFLTAIGTAFAHKLTFGDNINSEVRYLTFSPAYPLKIKLQTVERVVGVIVFQANEVLASGKTTGLTASPHITWAQDKDQLVISDVSGLSTAHTYNFTLLVSGG